MKSITEDKERKKLFPLILEEIGRNDLQRTVLQYFQKGYTIFSYNIDINNDLLSLSPLHMCCI